MQHNSADVMGLGTSPKVTTQDGNGKKIRNVLFIDRRNKIQILFRLILHYGKMYL